VHRTQAAIAGASLLGVVVIACGVSACSSSSARNHMTLINDTAVAVTVRDCLPFASLPCSAAPAKTLAPGRSRGFPLSAKNAASVPAYLVITGYGTRPRCFILPPVGALPEPPRANVTVIDSASCPGSVLLPSS
jgi:hypothetical protein